jgi:Glutathione S-transferase, C-terminal domain
VGEEENQKSPLIQHIASSRYLARLHGVTEDMSAYDEYVQDLVADEYMGFRDAWVQAAFNGSDDDKKKFKEDAIPTYLTKFDKLYAKFKTTGDEGVYLSTTSAGNPLWGDAAMFGFINMNTVQTSFTNLWNMYESFAKIEAVKEWLDKH